jgi:hypothetical protein
MNSPFIIYPVIIPGWIRPITHPDSPDCGVPLSLLVNRHLPIVVDPWQEMSKYDSAELLLNGSDTPAARKTIQPGEEDKTFTMDLPDAFLNDGVNALVLRVLRYSQSTPESSKPLKALVHRPRPGGDVPGSGDNPSLTMTLPADVIANGVDATRAAQGVDITLRYTYMRAQDVITLDLDSRPRTHTVSATEAAAGSVTLKLLAADFWQDNPRFAIRFRVVDLLGNSTGPQAIWSATTSLDVHVRKPVLDLFKPKVEEAKEGGGAILNFVKDFYYSDYATVKVAYTGSVKGHTVKVYWRGRATTYPTPIQTVQYAGETLTFLVPRSEVIDCTGSKAEIVYTVEIPGDPNTYESDDLDLSITAQKHHLAQPTLNGAKTNLRVYYPLLEAPYSVRISLQVDTNRYNSDEFPITQPSYTDVPVPPTWISSNKGKSGLFNFTLKRTGTAEPIIFSWYLRVTL